MARFFYARVAPPLAGLRRRAAARHAPPYPTPVPQVACPPLAPPDLGQTARRAPSPPPRLPASWGANYNQVGKSKATPGLAALANMLPLGITGNYGDFFAVGFPQKLFRKENQNRAAIGFLSTSQPFFAELF